jgi:hypothetical protein
MPPRECPSEPKNAELVVRLLHSACIKLGGEQALADHLGVSVGIVHMWLMGRGHPPDNVFLTCVDLLEERSAEESWGGKSCRT